MSNLDNFNEEELNSNKTSSEQTVDSIQNAYKDTPFNDMANSAKKHAGKRIQNRILNNKNNDLSGKAANTAGKGLKAAGRGAKAGAKAAGKVGKAGLKMAGSALTKIGAALLPYLGQLLIILGGAFILITIISLFVGVIVDNEFSRTNTANYYHMDVEETNNLLDSQLGSNGNVYFNRDTGRYELGRGKMPTMGNKLYFAYYAAMSKNSQWFVEYEVNPDFNLEIPPSDENPYYILRTIPENKRRYTLDGHLYSAINMDNVAERVNHNEPISPDVAFSEEVYTYIEKLAMNVNLLYLLDSTLHGSMNGMGKNQMFFAEQFVKPVYHTEPIETTITIDKGWWGNLIGNNKRKVKLHGYDFKPLTLYREMTPEELEKFSAIGRPANKLSDALVKTEEDSGLADDQGYQDFKQNGKVHFIGDSLLAGLGDTIKAQMPNSTVDAVVSRQFYGGSVDSGESALRRTPPGTETLVISLGTNAGIDDTRLGQFLDEASSYANNIVLVTTGSNVGHRESTNETIKRIASTRGNVSVIDWDEYVRNNDRSQIYGSDDIHMSDPGLFADFLVKGSYGANTLGSDVKSVNGPEELKFQNNYKSWTIMVETQNVNRGGSMGSEESSGQSSASGVDNPLLARAMQVGKEWVDAGFSYSMDSRMGPYSYDCSSFVSLVLKESGMVGVPDWTFTTITLLENTDTYGGKLFREIKPREDAKKGAIVVAGGLNGGGAAGHTAFLAEDYHGPETKIMESTATVNGGTYDLTLGSQIAWDPNWVAIEPIQGTLDGSDMPGGLNPGGPGTVTTPVGYTSSGKSVSSDGSSGGNSRGMSRNLTLNYDEPVKSEWNGMVSTGILIAKSREFDTNYDPAIINGTGEDSDIFRSQDLRYNIWRRDDFYLEEAPDGGSAGSGDNGSNPFDGGPNNDGTKMTTQSGEFLDKIKNWPIDSDDSSISADDINKYLDEMDTPSRKIQPEFLGNGKKFKEIADKYGVNVVVLLGQMALETQLGHATCGGAEYNFGCMMYADWQNEKFGSTSIGDRPWSNPPDAWAGVEQQAYLVQFNYIDKGYIRYGEYLERYSPGFENHTDGPNSSSHNGFARMVYETGQMMGYDFPNDGKRKTPGQMSDVGGSNRRYHNKDKRGTADIDGIANLQTQLDIIRFASLIGNSQFIPNQGPIIGESGGAALESEIFKEGSTAANVLNGYNEDRDDLLVWAMDNDFNPAHAVALVNKLSNNGTREFIGNKYNFMNDPDVIENIGSQGKVDIGAVEAEGEDITQLIERIMQDAPAGVRWQVAVEPIGNAGISPATAGNELGQQNSASTIKVALAVLAYKEGVVGSKVSEDQIRAMINQSDNDATNAVMRALGATRGIATIGDNFDAINSKLSGIGMNETSVGRFMGVDKNKANITTASDLAKLLANLDSYEGADKIKQYMTNTGTSGTRLLSDLPSGATGINKSGENIGLRNDTAIITANGKSVAIAVMMESSSGETGTLNTSIVDELQARIGKEIANKLLEAKEEEEKDEETDEEKEEDKNKPDEDARWQSDENNRLFDSRHGSQYYAYKYKVNDIYQGLDHVLELIKKDNPEGLVTSEILKKNLGMSEKDAAGVITLAAQLGALSEDPNLPEGTGQNVKVFTYGGSGPDDEEGLGNVRIAGNVDNTKIGDSLKYYTESKDVPFGDAVLVDKTEGRAIKGKYVEGDDNGWFSTWFGDPVKEYVPNMVTGIWDHGFGTIFKIAKQEYLAIPVYIDDFGEYKMLTGTWFAQAKNQFQGNGSMNVAVSDNQYIMLGVVTPFGSIDMSEEYIQQITKLNRILTKLSKKEKLTQAEITEMMNHAEKSLMVRHEVDEQGNTKFVKRRAEEEEGDIYHNVPIRDDAGNIMKDQFGRDMYKSVPEVADFYATNRVKKLDTKNKLRDTQGYQYLYDYLTNYETYVPHITEHNLNVVERFRRMNDIKMGEQEGVNQIIDIYNKLFDDGSEGGDGKGESGTGSTGEFGDMEENMKKVYKGLTDMGLSSAAAVGLISNMVIESNLDPTAVFGIYDSPGVINDAKKAVIGTGKPIGLIQWAFGRDKELINAAEAKGVDWFDLDFQIEYLFKDPAHIELLPKMNSEPNTKEGAQKAANGFFLVSEMHGGAMSFYDTDPHNDANALANGPDRNSADKIEKYWNTLVEDPIDGDSSKLSNSMGGADTGSSSSNSNSNSSNGGTKTSNVDTWGDGTGFMNNIYFAFNSINDTIMSVFGDGSRAQDPTMFATEPTYNDSEFTAYWMTKISRALGWGSNGNASNAGTGRVLPMDGAPIDPKAPGVTWAGGWGSYEGHRGIDIAGPEGTGIFAVKEGTVITINTGCVVGNKECGGGWGNHVLIKHSDGSATNYAHMSKVLVSVGDKVSSGQEIGKMGNTGRSSGSHLHFEVWQNASDSESRVPPENHVDFSIYSGGPARGEGVKESNPTGVDNPDGSTPSVDSTANSDTQLYHGGANGAEPWGDGELIINGADAYRWSKLSNKQNDNQARFVIRQFMTILESRDARPVYYDELYDRFNDYEESRLLEEYYKFNLLKIFEAQESKSSGDEWKDKGPSGINSGPLTSNDDSVEVIDTFADNGVGYTMKGEPGMDILSRTSGQVEYASGDTVIVRDDKLGMIAYYHLGTIEVSKGEHINKSQKIGTSNSDGVFSIASLQPNSNISEGLNKVKPIDYQDSALNIGFNQHPTPQNDNSLDKLVKEVERMKVITGDPRVKYINGDLYQVDPNTGQPVKDADGNYKKLPKDFDTDMKIYLANP